MSLLRKTTSAGRTRTAAVGVAALAVAAAVAATPGAAAAASPTCVGNPSAYVGTYHYHSTQQSGLTLTGTVTLDGFGNVFHNYDSEDGDDVVDGRWGMSTVTRQPSFRVDGWFDTVYYNISGTDCRNGRAETVYGSGSVDFRDGPIVRHTFVMNRTR